MKDITIKKSSPLYRLVAFLSDFPIFSMFLKYDFEGGRYNSFNDICTFTRHLLYSLATVCFYLLVIAICIYIFIIAPITVIAGVGTSILGKAVLIFLCGTACVYTTLLVIQKLVIPALEYMYDRIFNRPEKSEDVVQKEVKPDSAFKAAFKIVAQKHNNFCKRLKVEND